MLTNEPGCDVREPSFACAVRWWNPYKWLRASSKPKQAKLRDMHWAFRFTPFTSVSAIYGAWLPYPPISKCSAIGFRHKKHLVTYALCHGGVCKDCLNTSELPCYRKSHASYLQTFDNLQCTITRLPYHLRINFLNTHVKKYYGCKVVPEVLTWQIHSLESASTANANTLLRILCGILMLMLGCDGEPQAVDGFSPIPDISHDFGFADERFHQHVNERYPEEKNLSKASADI